MTAPTATSVEVEVTGAQRVRGLLAQLEAGLRDRSGVHAEIAGESETLTAEYLRGLNRHRTANRLGAAPTYHYENSSRLVEGQSDSEAATVRMPRSTGLGRAFRKLTIRPTRSGIKYLTIPAHRRTYGKRVSDFPADAFRFVLFGKRHRALLFASGSDKGDVAYWLKKSVTIAQDRTLLPDEEAYQAAAVGASRRYVRRILGKEGDAS